MAPTTLPSHFAEFSRLLSQESVDYLLIGGWALALYGYAKYTDDVDLWFHRAADNAARLLRVLHRFGVEGSSLTPEDLLVERRVFCVAAPPRTLELHNTIHGVDFPACHARRIAVTVDDITIPVISRDDLVLNKRTRGRLRDLADVDELGG